MPDPVLKVLPESASFTDGIFRSSFHRFTNAIFFSEAMYCIVATKETVVHYYARDIHRIYVFSHVCPWQ